MKKLFAILGMLISVAVLICGILTLSGEMGGNTSHPGSAPYSYDSGYATFGGDFYTFVNNNAAEAAAGAYTAANNLQDVAELLKNVCGIFLMGFGAMGFCLFGILLAEGKRTVPPVIVRVAPEQIREAAYSEEE